MIDPDTLNVWNEQRLVGYLWRNPIGTIGFRYDTDWVAEGGFAISRTLPLGGDDFAAEDGVAHRFFANLLPEGGVRGVFGQPLKFELPDYRHLPAYETFTTHLAGAIGLPVVAIELRTIGRSHYALIARYDRPRDARGEVRRLHQEDFCQALGIGHEKKYQDSGGPSFAQCYRLVRDASSDPAIDTQHLLRWQIFNVLAGNSDGHAKNLSLLHWPHGQIRLAPFYDLVCTRAIARIDPRLALDVGGERNPGAITRGHWEALARQCEVRPRFLCNLVEATATLLMKKLALEKAVFEARFGAYPALQRSEHIVTKQCQRAIRM